uniref:Uncharacterized protein n=1 Tax=Rhizophora mucronata TaxID=61149 RepID=A0A2P2QVG2_RHIMU
MKVCVMTVTLESNGGSLKFLDLEIETRKRLLGKANKPADLSSFWNHFDIFINDRLTLFYQKNFVSTIFWNS